MKYVLRLCVLKAQNCSQSAPSRPQNSLGCQLCRSERFRAGVHSNCRHVVLQGLDSVLWYGTYIASDKSQGDSKCRT